MQTKKDKMVEALSSFTKHFFDKYEFDRSESEIKRDRGSTGWGVLSPGRKRNISHAPDGRRRCPRKISGTNSIDATRRD